MSALTKSAWPSSDATTSGVSAWQVKFFLFSFKVANCVFAPTNNTPPQQTQAKPTTIVVWCVGGHAGFDEAAGRLDVNRLAGGMQGGHRIARLHRAGYHRGCAEQAVEHFDASAGHRKGQQTVSVRVDPLCGRPSLQQHLPTRDGSANRWFTHQHAFTSPSHKSQSRKQYR